MYIDFILDNMPRILTQIDRDKHATTYGCCDRNHWHLKIRDFSSAILQQSGLALAISYNLDFEGNIYYKNENIKEWAIATVEYWAKIQLRDGSFNEYYPHEHGFPPTAFSLYSACEVYKRLNMNSDFVKSRITRTCKYLVSHIEEHAFNQEMASIAALYSAYKILQEEWIIDGLSKKLQRILALQSAEGWFPEYGGADLGYLSVCFDMLCEYYYMSKDETVYPAMLKTMDFMQYFIHPDSTVGGEYGSRNTTYFLPNGLQVLSSKGVGIAERALEVLFGNTRRSNYFLNSTDDRYFSHYLMHSFLRALEKRQNASQAEVEEIPFEYGHSNFFDISGLVSFANNNYATVLSLKKGGVIKVYIDGKEKFIDCGYRVDYGKGCVAATNWIDPSYEIRRNSSNEYEVEGNFNQIKLKVPSPILNTGLRALSFIFGQKLIKFLKKSIIFVDNHVDIKFKRKFEFKDNSILIYDELRSDENVILEKANNMSLRHVASGKFYMESDLIHKEMKFEIKNRKISIKTTFDIENCKLSVESHSEV